MKVTSAQIEPLSFKHYETSVAVVVEIDGKEYPMRVNICGYAPKASVREIERGWEPDWGMDHTESEAHLKIAEMICKHLPE